MSEDKQPDELDTSAGEQPADTEIAQLREQLDEALREKEQFRALAQRAQADLVNYRRRASEERDDIKRHANSELLLKVLSVVDDFNRALGHMPQDAVSPGWYEGLMLVKQNLENLLTSEGVNKIEAEGQPFEPREHEALFYEETPGVQEGTVVQVVRDGYKLHGKVLRAAQVSVAKAPAQENNSSQNSESESTHQEGE